MMFRRKKKRVDSSADLPSDGQLRVQLDQLTASTGSREITRTEGEVREAVMRAAQARVTPAPRAAVAISAR